MPSPHSLKAADRLRRRLEQAKLSIATSEHKPKRSRTLPSPDRGTLSSCAVHVCTSCRSPSPGPPSEPKQSRLGSILYQQLREAFDASPLRYRVDVRPAECLSICPHPCGIAISLPGAWTYLFGDQRPDETTPDVVECVFRYLESPDGFMLREQCPIPLRGSILGWVPPSLGNRRCT